jgi:dinuclear metal center YbgI/SA1388 family protein
MKAADVVKVIEKAAPRSLGIDNDEYGFVHGNGEQEVKKVGVTWSATTPVIKEAASKGINMLIVHEFVFIPHFEKPGWYEDYPKEEKLINIARKKLLDENKICVFRTHSPWDACPKLGVVDSFADFLGLNNVISANRFNKTYEIKQTTVEAFAKEVKKKMNLNVRVFGDIKKKITRVTPLIGGFGGNLTNMIEEFARKGTDLIIAGDLTENTLLFALELGIPILETLHSEMENPGMISMKNYLSKQLPQLEVHYLASGAKHFPNTKITVI